ncbi:MAG: cobalamin-binding protein [Dehalococcoidia bacterium]|nr:cobalamin-binding protein [Dehalococcoidia bacterium]MDD5493127.1 cobalamin-binding protein [Dehalococcoidia bacterium]
MRRSGIIPCTLILVVLSVIFLSCGIKNEPVLQYDDIDTPVRTASTPKKIVSLAPSNTEIVYALKLQDSLLGVTDYCNYPPEADSKIHVGGFSTIDIEKTIALQPDLILAAEIHSKSVTPALEKIGFNVLTLNPKTLSAILKDIMLVGELTGNKDQATELNNALQNRVDAVSNKSKVIPVEQRRRVLLLIWHDPLMAAGNGTLIDDMIRTSGGTNIAQDIAGHGAISLETILARDPQVIIAPVSMGKPENPLWDYLNTDARLKNTSAIKNKCVYQVDGDLVYRFGPRAVQGLEQLSNFIYPETSNTDK